MVSIKLIGLFVVLCAALLPSVYGVGLARIVGGVESSIEKRPYQASLQYKSGNSYSHTCGASIISTKFLLSAAHCNPEANLNILYVRVGATSYNSGGQVLKVGTFTPHPSYNRNYLDYDFAIVSLSSGQEILLGSNVAIVTLSSGSDPIDGSMVTVSGWGVTNEEATSLPVVLREINLPVVSQSTCRRTYVFITSRQICLGGTPQGSMSSCFGDSGGPAVQNGVQYGLVSGGNSCTLPNIPGIYARISSVRSWITSLTGV